MENEKHFLGIDTGLSGGLSIINSDLKIVRTEKMPKAKNEALGNHVSAKILYLFFKDIFDQYRNLDVMIEQVSPFAIGSKKAAFSFGANFSLIIYILEILNKPYSTCNPNKKGWQMNIWKEKDMVYYGKKKDTKATTLNALTRIFDEKDIKQSINYRMSPKGNEIFDDGILDSIGIAFYGYTIANGSKTKETRNNTNFNL